MRVRAAFFAMTVLSFLASGATTNSFNLKDPARFLAILELSRAMVWLALLLTWADVDSREEG